MLRPKSLDQGQDQLPRLRRRAKNDATKSGSQKKARKDFLLTLLTCSQKKKIPPESQNLAQEPSEGILGSPLSTQIRDMASSDRFRRSSDRPASKAGTSSVSEQRNPYIVYPSTLCANEAGCTCTSSYGF